MTATQLAKIIDITEYQATLEIIRGHVCVRRRAEFIAGELVIGVKQRVGIRLVAVIGKPVVRARATSHDAVGELLGLLADLDIRIASRRAALDDIRRALDVASIARDIPKPPREHSIDCLDVLDCADAGDCLDVGDLLSSCDLPDCDVPDCDLDCDPGCF